MSVVSACPQPDCSRPHPKSPGCPAESLADLVSSYAVEVPQTEWIRRLNLTQPRENLTCLPVGFRLGKRSFDIFGSILLLVLCSPILLAAAALVKLTSPGPVIYSQTRVGLNLRKKSAADRRRYASGIPESLVDRREPGRDRREASSYGMPFTIYKLRTMRADAERHGARFASAGDSRVTSVGRWLRRTRIDELPQLWNVLRGDMSLVGPRPERPEFMQQLSQQIPDFVDRLGLRPGLTGIAQVVNGYDNEIGGFRRKVAYDLLYLQNCCLTCEFCGARSGWWCPARAHCDPARKARPRVHNRSNPPAVLLTGAHHFDATRTGLR